MQVEVAVLRVGREDSDAGAWSTAPSAATKGISSMQYGSNSTAQSCGAIGYEQQLACSCQAAPQLALAVAGEGAAQEAPRAQHVAPEAAACPAQARLAASGRPGQRSLLARPSHAEQALCCPACAAEQAASAHCSWTSCKGLVRVLRLDTGAQT